MKLRRLSVINNFRPGMICLGGISNLSALSAWSQAAPTATVTGDEPSEEVGNGSNQSRPFAYIYAYRVLDGADRRKHFSPKSDQHSVNKLAIAESTIQQLLLLLDANKNGKITKQDFMRFMEVEFDRLDKNKLGELDVKELARAQLRVSSFASVGK